MKKKKADKRGRAAKKVENTQKRRNNVKYPGLEKVFTLKIRQEVLDQDYINKLSKEEKQWLSDFNEEWVNCNFNHPGKKFHKSKKQKKKIYDMNNARNRDAYSITKSNNILKDEVVALNTIETFRSTNPAETEDTLIEVIDKKITKF